MGDPLSVASGVIAIVAATFQSSKILYQTVHSFKSHQTTVKRLTSELAELTRVLRLLQDHARTNGGPLEPLKFPLLQCCKACQDFKELIEKCAKHSGSSRTSWRDWVRLGYMSSDVADFTQMLAGYKATINIALADANLRSSKATLEVLNEYKDMIQDTKCDLVYHLEQLNRKLDSPTLGEYPNTWPGPAINTQRLQGDKDGTENCIEYCRRLLTQIDSMQFEVVGQKSSSSTAALISPKGVAFADALTLSTLKDCSTRITDTLTQLEGYRQRQLDKKAATMQLDPELDRRRLQSEASSTEQRLEFCEGASYRASQARVHILENIVAGNNSTQMCVSTLNELFNIKGATAGHGSFQFFGSTSDRGLTEILKMQNQEGHVQNTGTRDEMVYEFAMTDGNSSATGI